MNVLCTCTVCLVLLPSRAADVRTCFVLSVVCGAGVQREEVDARGGVEKCTCAH